MIVPPPSLLVPSCAKWFFGGTRQTDLDFATWEGPLAGAYMGHRRGTQLHIALLGRTSLHIALAGWQT
jgi:hypothetical protein